MALRTIMIFPKFKNMEIIDAIRAEYDPLSQLVQPHITLAFPFELKLSDEELSTFIDDKLLGIRPFTIRLHGISKSENTYGNYLFLDVTEGNEKLAYIHSKLYTDELKGLKPEQNYVPHMTIGKFKTEEELMHAYDKVKGLKAEFRTVVDTISIEMIGKNEESMIIIEKELH